MHTTTPQSQYTQHAVVTASLRKQRAPVGGDGQLAPSGCPHSQHSCSTFAANVLSSLQTNVQHYTVYCSVYKYGLKSYTRHCMAV